MKREATISPAEQILTSQPVVFLAGDFSLDHDKLIHDILVVNNSSYLPRTVNTPAELKSHPDYNPNTAIVIIDSSVNNDQDIKEFTCSDTALVLVISPLDKRSPLKLEQEKERLKASAILTSDNLEYYYLMEQIRWLQGISVLIVDDHPENRLATSAQIMASLSDIAPQGIRATCFYAASSTEATQIASIHPPDIILLDKRLNLISEYLEVIRYWRSNLRQTVLAIISAESLSPSEERDILAASDNIPLPFFRKPFFENEITNYLRQILVSLRYIQED